MRPFRTRQTVAPAWRDRWLIAYADTVTLLFACFAGLYIARMDFKPATVGTMPRPGVAAAAPDLRRRLATLVGSTHAGLVELRDDTRGFVISLPEVGSFAPGQAELTPAAQAFISDLDAVLRDSSNVVRVEGHTDDTPIHTPQFHSNWELSTARATRVVQFLIDRGLPPARLSAAGYGEYHPRGPNDSPASRARNRRVDIVIQSGPP